MRRRRSRLRKRQKFPDGGNNLYTAQFDIQEVL